MYITSPLNMNKINKENTHVVIMAGGIGSRLWPISTPELPKQFIDVLGVGKSLIQMTVDRFLPVCDISRFWVVTSEKYTETVHNQLPQIPMDQILAEPEPRNTAPCIAYACWKIKKKYPNANVVVTPSDALVLNKVEFTAAISAALAKTETSDSIVTIGITPTRPETGYGYIKAEKAVQDEIVKVEEFKEKPDQNTAEKYLAAGNYFWNAGIFVWKVETIVDQLKTFAPNIASIMDELDEYLYTDNEAEALKRLFPQCEKISIDYAVMEKSQNIYVISSSLGWSDLGSWGSVKSYLHSDAHGNRIIGKDVRLFNTKNCVVHADDTDTVVVEGLNGYVVAVSGGKVLVCRLSEEQHIKEYSTNQK